MANNDLPDVDATSLSDPSPSPAPAQSKKRGRPKGSKNKGASATTKLTDAQLTKALEEALIFPAIPSMMFYPKQQGKQYLATHFTMAGPWGAERLVIASKSSPALRVQLERIAQGSVGAVILSFIGVYLGAPALFILGQARMAESLTMSTQVDEAAMGQMVTNMMPDDMMDDHAPSTEPSADANDQAGQRSEARESPSEPNTL